MDMVCIGDGVADNRACNRANGMHLGLLFSLHYRADSVNLPIYGYHLADSNLRIAVGRAAYRNEKGGKATY